LHAGDSNVAIYLDNASTTQPFPEVLEAMTPYLSDDYGNPSSMYYIGRKVRKALDEARDSVADELGVKSGEITFCSGASESICLNIIGAALAMDEKRRRFVTSSIEHKAVLKTAHWLMEHLNWDVTFVDPEPSGHINPDKFVDACSNGCGIASLQWVNNEIGCIQPVEEVASRLKAMGVVVHSDIVQGIGKMPIDLGATDVDIASASAHKFYGPKGCGLTYIREGVDVKKIVVGGGQEMERRAGTENAAGIIGLATALAIVAKGRVDFVKRLKDLEKAFLDVLKSEEIEFKINGSRPQIPGLINLYLHGIESESLLLHADRDGVCFSAGSACAAGSTEPSYVMTALGMNRLYGLCSIRVAIGWHNTLEDVTQGAKIIASIVSKLRGST
jgi:cysteine desulfurase